MSDNTVRSFSGDTDRYSVGLYSIIGSRKGQQDYAAVYGNDNDVLGILCDGMGGMEAGDRASSGAAAKLIDAYKVRDIRIPVPQFFRDSALRINAEISSLKNSHGKRLDTGTTLLAVSLTGNLLYWLSVGDSRIYVLRGKDIVQVNREHNYREKLNEDLHAGRITRVKYDSEIGTRRAEALTSYIGIPVLELMEINQKPFKMQPGDMVLLCSDGLYRSLRNDQILALANDNEIDLDIAADRLCEMALHYGGASQDNTTVLIIRYNGETENLNKM